MSNATPLDAGPPPYDTDAMLALPIPERLRLCCKTFAYQVNSTPVPIYIAYWLKYLLLYCGGWAFFCQFSAGVGTMSEIASWAFTVTSFQKAVLFAMGYEVLGLGCSSGPMTARFKPPIGGILYFARPGTTKLPFFPGIPIFGGNRRTWFDAALYLALVGVILRALLAPAITFEMLLPAVILLPLLGLTDKTIMLAARYEHYYVALVCLTFAFAGDLWIAACKVIWVCVWFWAATSKVNNHFSSVIAVMLTNSPWIPVWLRKKLYVDYPDDLRTSPLASAMAHMGTATEWTFPFVLLLSDGGMVTAVALTVMLGFHTFIAGNMPSGMPIEWNITMVFGGFFLFGHHPEVSVLSLQEVPLLVAFMFFNLILVPLYGNFFPKHVSFLSSMRYYAGNWAYGVWLFKGDSQDKLAKLVKPSGTMEEQLMELTGDEAAVKTALLMGSAQRLMHLEGRALHDALPAAVDNLDDYTWVEGEVLCGIVVGWNFGDGHLHTEQLIEAVQEQCDFEAGELRVVMVESQPLFGKTMEWRVVDAASGEIARGASKIAEMRERLPWPTGERAAAFTRGVRETT